MPRHMAAKGLALWLMFLGPNIVYAQTVDSVKTIDPFSMSLEELLSVKLRVPAAMTQLAPIETPASITIISSEDIRRTPSRNIYDLIEVYVPGAIWMNYEEGPQLGIRGIIANVNNKVLLRVNGKTVNNKAKYGAMSELEQWELSDIDRIEIIRGPGSVVYGPGAITAVINIITKSARSDSGFGVSTSYRYPYNSKGVTVSHGYQSPELNIYGFASIRNTKGYAARQFLGTKAVEAGYVGETIKLDEEPLDYFADFDDQPQIKLHLEAEIGDHLSIWARYTNQGSTWHGNETKTLVSDKLVNLQSVRNQQFITVLGYENDLGPEVSLNTMVSFISSDAERRGDELRIPDRDHILNKKSSFGESEIFLRSTLNWKVTNTLEIAAGLEYAHDSFGPPWGKSKADMRLGDNGILVSDSSSNAILAGNKGSADRGGTAIFVGNGWDTDTYSLFTEANWALNSRLKILASGRLDKNTYSGWLISPRVATIFSITRAQFIKLIVQESVRMNNSAQLYTEAQKGLDPNTERLRGIELAYSAITSSNIIVNISAFMNAVEVVGFEGDLNVTLPVGKLNLYGLETALKYDWSSGNIGFSYSFVKQIDWTMADGIISSGISYSDYNQPFPSDSGTTSPVQTGVGNDLANWPNQAIKLFGHISLNDRITLHGDARALWDFQGWKDGLTGLGNALAGNVAVETAIQQARDVGTYEGDFRANASISIKVWDNLNATAFVQNLFGSGNNKRYSYDNGNNKPAPAKVRFVEEPRMWGLRLEFQK